MSLTNGRNSPIGGSCFSGFQNSIALPERGANACVIRVNSISKVNKSKSLAITGFMIFFSKNEVCFCLVLRPGAHS